MTPTNQLLLSEVLGLSAEIQKMFNVLFADYKVNVKEYQLLKTINKLSAQERNIATLRASGYKNELEITNVIKKLRNKDLIKIDNSDFIILTDKGISFLQKTESYDQFIDAPFTSLSKLEKIMFLKLLSKIHTPVILESIS